MASSLFIKFEDVEGESTDEKHTGDIEIFSWSHGFNAPGGVSRSTSGNAQVARGEHSALTVNKESDKASTSLMKACWSGKHFPKVTITSYRDTGEGKRQDYLVIEMTDVIIESFSLGAGSELPMETLSLNYGTVKYAYKPTDQKTGDAQGVAPAFADLITNVQS